MISIIASGVIRSAGAVVGMSAVQKKLIAERLGLKKTHEVAGACFPRKMESGLRQRRETSATKSFCCGVSWSSVNKREKRRRWNPAPSEMFATLWRAWLRFVTLKER